MSYVEMDPSRRYGRLQEILGRGAMKTVYKAFDEVLGMEVAWSQARLTDVLSSPSALPSLYSEVHLLKNLNHESIIRCYSSWIDTERRTFNFITEMLTSGTLREYRLKFKEVDIRAIKNWARQILQGLAYLHCLDPPVIHRDLKCDNIFVNGHLGQVKIGDLGLAAILHGSQHAHSLVGTPEFMAPEIYKEKYNELVDVYAFGLCVLEMLTTEYPYSECSDSVHIFNKVEAGKKPRAFHHIQDAETKRFVARCLEDASTRPSARELLLDPFLAHNDDPMSTCRIGDSPFLFSDCIKSTYMTITGTVNTVDKTLSLRVRISDKDGHADNVDFPFDITKDTAIDVAMEMIKEVAITDRDPHEIAEMIEDELYFLVPKWKAMNSPQSLQQRSVNFNDNNENHTSHDSLAGFLERREEPLLQDPNPLVNSENNHQGHLALNSEKSLPDSSHSNSLQRDESKTLQRDESETEGFSRSSSLTNTTTKGKEKRNGISDTVKDLGSTSRWKFGSFCNQLLSRTLLGKPRSTKTVAAVENIGFHDPS